MVTAVDHELGSYRKVRKANSPFTSFSYSATKAAKWGSQQIKIDLDRLRADIASGDVQGVEVLDTPAIIALLRAEPYNNFIQRGINFAVAEEEVMIKGIIPKKYLLGGPWS